MSRTLSLGFCFFGVVSLLSSALFGQCESGETAISADRDNTLYEDGAGALSNGAGDHFFVGRVGQPTMELARRGLVHFDVAAALSPDSVVTSAVLTLNMSRTIAFDEIIGLFPMLTDWGEGDSHAPGQEGGGAPPATGDATWIHSFFDTATWTDVGGDFVPAASATTEVDTVGSYSWGSTAEMVADVQDWLDTPASNHGWILIGNENSGTTAKRFDSRENIDPALQPVLCVGTVGRPIIEIPTLGGVSLALLALLLVTVAWKASRSRPADT